MSKDSSVWFASSRGNAIPICCLSARSTLRFDFRSMTFSRANHEESTLLRVLCARSLARHKNWTANDFGVLLALEKIQRTHGQEEILRRVFQPRLRELWTGLEYRRKRARDLVEEDRRMLDERASWVGDFYAFFNNPDDKRFFKEWDQR